MIHYKHEDQILNADIVNRPYPIVCIPESLRCIVLLQSLAEINTFFTSLSNCVSIHNSARKLLTAG